MNLTTFLALASVLTCVLMQETRRDGSSTTTKTVVLKFHGSRNHLINGLLSDNRYYVRNSPTGFTSATALSLGTVCDVNGTVLDCSSRGLPDIPPFPSPCLYTSVSFFNNSIQTIPDSSFKKCKNLIYLDLRNNIIKYLCRYAFLALINLEHLDLRDNDLYKQKNRSPYVFKPLRSLRTLKLQGNVKNKDKTLNYPDKSLSYLNRLETLEIDGLTNKSFGPGFKNMSSLRNLTLYHCHLQSVNGTFDTLMQIEVLNISHCQITDIDSNAFVNLTSMKMLDVSWNAEIGIGNLVKVFKSMNISNLTHMRMQGVVPQHSIGRRITREDVMSLPRTLTHLTVSSNNIEILDEDVFDAFPENLTFLDAGDNRFRFGSYLKYINKLENLQTLMLNGLDIVSGLPSIYPNHVRSNPVCSRNDDDMEEEEDEANCFVQRLPWKLEKVSMDNAQLRYKLTEFQVDSNNSLRELNIQGNIIPFIRGPWIGFDKLQVFRLKDNGIGHVSSIFFQNLTSLTHLDLGSNTIGDSVKGSHVYFKYGSSLKFLNLSFNIIEHKNFNPKLLHGLHDLEELYLQKNELWHFDFEISHLKKLRVLNLSNTALPTLQLSVRNYIDSLNNPTLDMSENPILCTCSNLDFLEWMVNSTAFKESLRTQRYKCEYDKGTESIITDGYQKALADLREKCITKFVLFLASLVGSLVTTCVVVGLILYRFRWKLRYLYYAAYLSLKDKREHSQREEFSYDVFVSYAEPDEQFVVESIVPELRKRELKLLVHGRDFAAGDYIASNIVTAVKESKRTLVVLTSSLIKSAWCNYEVQMANVESAHTGRPVLVFLLKESIPNRQLGRELLSHIRKNTFLPYPEGQIDGRLMKMFWDKLGNDLKN